MNYPPDGDALSLNADSLTLTAECNHVLYKPCIVININKPHLETLSRVLPACREQSDEGNNDNNELPLCLC